MAFVDPTQDPDQQNQNPSQVDQALNPSAAAQSSAQATAASQQAPTTSAGGGSAGVASTGGGGGAGAAGSPASTPKPSSSGSWTNLDQYLNANADQATGVGQQIAQSVDNTGNQAQSDITNLGTNFNSAVNADTVNQNQTAVNQAVTDATSATAANPTINSGDLSAYQQQANANYNGPTDVTAADGYSQAQQDINTATQNANETQSEAGRDVLLNNQYQNASANGYNQGENNLDQLLLQDSSGAQAALQPLAQQWSGLTGALGSTVSTGDVAAQNAAATDQATANAAQSALSTANANFQNQLNTGLAALQTTNSNSYNQILGDLKSGTLSPADYTALGIDPSTHIYGGTNAQGAPTGTVGTNYLTQGSAPTLQSYATADQYAQAAALAQMAGQSTSPYLDPGSVSQAGTAETAPAYTFNSSQFANDNAANQQNYQTQVNSVIQAVNNGFSFGNTSVNGAGVSNIGDAVNYLNNLVAWNGNGSSMSNTEKGWAMNQLNVINQAQAANGFAPYQVYNGPPVTYGQPLPSNWQKNNAPQTGGLNLGNSSSAPVVMPGS